MAKQVKYVQLTLSNGETRLIRTKTITENYIRKIVADMILPAHVMRWEVIV